MKKIVGLLLSVIMLFSVVTGSFVTANAGVRYDTDKASDTSTYKMLNIYGRNYYKNAFSCLNKLNAARTSKGAAKLSMDKDLLTAAMLKAHESSVHYALDRANGDDWETIVDGNAPILAYQCMATSLTPDIYDAAAKTWLDSYGNVITDPAVKSAGLGCFKSEETGLTYWVLFLSASPAVNKVVASDFSNSVARKETVALHKNYWGEFNEKHIHAYVVSSVTKKASATDKTNGKLRKKCKVCSRVITTAISYPKKVVLSDSSYTYNGKTRKPTVTVKDANGNKISSSFYTVTYASGRKNVGKYKVTVKFKTRYTGSLSKYFTIKPKSTSITSVSAGKKKFTVKWSKRTAQTSGYQVQYSTSSKFKSPKTKTVSGYGKTSKTITDLKSKKKYYVRVRTYKTVNGTKYYSSWSKYKNITTK